MTVLSTLIRARALISPQADWCQIHVRDEDGRRCALGAIMDAGGSTIAALAALRTALRAMNHQECLAIYNDTHTHSEVLALFDRAIAIERMKELAAKAPNSLPAWFVPKVTETV